jgi:hypothetical protein
VGANILSLVEHVSCHLSLLPELGMCLIICLTRLICVHSVMCKVVDTNERYLVLYPDFTSIHKKWLFVLPLKLRSIVDKTVLVPVI